MSGIIRVEKLTKKFGDFTANDGIDFEVQKGEIRAIIGENGAGKTTLMNMLYGLLQPTSGQIFFEDAPVKMNSPKDAISNGIGMVHQHFKLSPSLTVYENVLLGLEIKKKLRIGKRSINLPIIDNALERQKVDELIKKYNFNLNPNDKIRDLSVGARP